jgi:hypothetical protein
MKTKLPSDGTYRATCIAKVKSSADVSELIRRGNASGERSDGDGGGDEGVARRKDVGAVVIQSSSCCFPEPCCENRKSVQITKL